MRRSILTYLIFGFVANLFSQNYYFDNYGVAEGLDQSKVYDVLQADDHYIWIGTQTGASVFDGVSFIHKNEKNGLAPNGVKKLFKDPRGRIWMGHIGGGISVFDNNNISTVELPDITNESDITSFIEDTAGNLWITSSSSGAYFIANYIDDLENHIIEPYKEQSFGWIFGSSRLNDGTLLFITEVGIKKYIPESNAFEPFYIEGLDLYFQFIDVFQDSNDNIWFGTHNGGLYRYFPQQDTFIYYDEKNGLADKWVSSISEDSYGNIWIGTWGGGISCFKKNGEIINFDINNGLQDNKIYCIKEDIEGNLLIGTWEHGLSIFKGFQFMYLSAKDGLASNQVTAIEQDKDSLYWFGTNNGITIFKDQKEKVKTLNKASQNISNSIVAIKKDLSGNMWVGSEEGVYKYYHDLKRFEYDIVLNNKLMGQQQTVTALEIDKWNQLWVGTFDGLVYYETNKWQGDRLSQRNGIAGNEITALYIDSKDILWIGSRNKGVTQFFNETSDFKIVEALGDITPVSFTEDNKKNIWIALENNGVVVYNGDSVTHRFNSSNGLLSNMVTALNADNQNVYIGTNRGLNIFNYKLNKIFTYTEKGGFVGIETKKNATFKDQNGDIWFGTVNGAIKYSPDKEVINNLAPLTHIKSVEINNETRNLTGGTKLKHFENNIIFNYYSICLKDPTSVKYQYRLLGSDEPEWAPVTKVKSRLYERLEPGEYSFEVRAQNNYGIWNQQPITTDFWIIKPAFYETSWFITFCIVLGALIVFTYIKIRERNLITEKVILEETVKERTFELQEKKDQLEMYNKDITDSIQYAQRIQFAMLPPGPPFDDTFVLFLPKDIVSGDFYWFQTHEGLEFMSAVDCTGHGVPGAFMSIIGYNTLNKLVKEHNIYQPSKILEGLNKEIIINLQKKDLQNDFDQVKDGMDLSLVSYNSKSCKLQYSGAYNPLLLIRNGELLETKATRTAIGQDMETEFKNHEIDIEKGDTIYLFSDGYADQFGGEKRKKFMVAKLKRLLISIKDLDMHQQKSELEKQHIEWKGTEEQVDDILIIGRRF